MAAPLVSVGTCLRSSLVVSTRSLLEAKESFLGEESVEAGIGLSSLSHESSQCENGVFSTDHLAVLIDLKACWEAKGLT